jgi:RoxA-like, cytochrome c-like
MSDTGTDSQTYDNIYKRTGPSEKLEGGFVDVVNVTTQEKIPATADGLTMVTNEVIGTILGVHREAPKDDLSRVDFRKKHDRAHLVNASEDVNQPKYKGRAFDGIWATAPYLHNGSVPNLYELLLPPAQRSTSFSIGVRSFDPEKVGYLTDVPGFPKFSAKDAQGKWIPGNRNDGHDFGSKPTEDERHQLLEYLKTL